MLRTAVLLCLGFTLGAPVLQADFSFTILDDRNPFITYGGTGPGTIQPYTVANSINNNGQVAGVGCCDFTGLPAGNDVFVYDHGTLNLQCYSAGLCVYTPFQDLGPIPYVLTNQNSGWNVAGFNNQGVVVGNLSDVYGESRGWVQSSPSQGPSGLNYPGLLLGYGASYITGINDLDQIIGHWINYTDGSSGGYLYQGGVFTNLAFTPYGINHNGQIVGVNDAGNVVIYSNGSFQNLGILPFTPTGINDKGQIVGGQYLYSAGVLIPVQVPGATSTQVNGINDDGTLAGSFQTPEGTFGFIAATPEPGYLALLFAGLGGLVLFRRKTA